MPTQLLSETVDFIMTQNNISFSMNDSYSDKIHRLKDSGLLINDEEFYCSKKTSDLTKDIDQDISIQTFFKDGIYTVSGVGVPSCTFPNGAKYNGKVKISSIFQCDDPTQPFVQKNICSETQSDINTIRITITSFNIDTICVTLSNLGSFVSGQYNIINNYLYTNRSGYGQGIGQHGKFQDIYEKTPGGFTLLTYYLDTNNKYQIKTMRKYILQSS